MSPQLIIAAGFMRISDVSGAQHPLYCTTLVEFWGYVWEAEELE